LTCKRPNGDATGYSRPIVGTDMMMSSEREFDQTHDCVNVPRLSHVREAFDEFRFYWFGLRMGLANLLRNGTRLGLPKTIGKITQPVNSFTRFPEYALMDEAIRTFLQAGGFSKRLRVLDVGSPKCFGLYLASTLDLDVELTDISPLNVDEYETIWKAIQEQAEGSVRFALQDARSLQYESNQFDIAYTMSVLEHIEGQKGDEDGIREMVRVLKPGGLLLLSVPFGTKYVEQRRKGLAHAVENTGDEGLYFFQRIYDRTALEGRIFAALDGLEVRSEWTIWRERESLVRIFAGLGERLRGLLGFLNPWLSRCSNRCKDGIVEGIPGSYGPIHSKHDSYGDVVLVAQKRVNP